MPTTQAGTSVKVDDDTADKYLTLNLTAVGGSAHTFFKGL
jgi:hypothetical protein